MTGPVQQMRNFVRCHVWKPLLRLIRKGVTPRRLAWSLAVAIIIGINPFLGVTTVSMILLAAVFRLNHIATQIGIHVVAPLQWLLFLPFIRLGMLLFHSQHMPLTRAEIMRMSERHPVHLIRVLWQWEWHALIIWAGVSALLLPFLAIQIRRTLVYAMRRHRVVTCAT